MSQQELRYLWVLVSLSATEWVQEVLLEGHPSWKYLEEVHTLLLDVKQGLPVSRAEVQVATVGACVRVCVWPKTIKGEGKGVESSGMSWRVWEKWGGAGWWTGLGGQEMRLRPCYALQPWVSH